jgi:hypothetical protein
MELDFKEQPHIGNRSDALELLDQLLTAESTYGLAKALLALKDAIEQGII